MKRKKKWKEPELIVIVRCKPEESVLNVCKASRYNCSAPNNYGPAYIIASS